ncbi:hypothetical protein DID80_06235 [Candidatus Marinamargulisbacteria bacterium SCGC AAA071-K20]|nr:hypothetical protein DID80_06235 [Candidatus Marinamargulisbacteria bacterium SCGC AAA071-K20]
MCYQKKKKKRVRNIINYRNRRTLLKKSGKVLFFGILLFQTLLFADDLSFTARVNSQRLSLSSYLSYEVVISGEDISSLPKLTLPDFKGKFDVISSSKQSSFSFSNGQVSNSEIRKFSLLPVKTGDIIIGSAAIKYKGKTYKTNIIKVTVMPPVSSSAAANNQAAAAQTSQASKKPKNNKQFANIFADAKVDKTSVYVGEQLTFNLKLYRRLRLFSDIAFEIPEFNGFWVEPLEANKDESLDRTTGRRFHVRELEKKALFPLKPGTIIIPKSRVGVVINMFEGQKLLQSKAIKVSVKPLPEVGKPDGFSGLVGEFQLHGALSSRQVSENNSITYKVTLSGRGNLRSIENINYEKDGTFKIYRAKVEDKLQNVSVISGERIFSYIVIPKKSGEVSVPSFKLSYFSPEDKQYKVISLPAVPIRVYEADTTTQIETESYLPSSQKLAVLTEDLQYLRTPLDLSQHYSALDKGMLFMALLYFNYLAAVCLLLAIIKKYYWKTDFKALRSKRAFESAVAAVNALDKTNTGHYLSQCQTIILDFLSDKIGESLLGKTQPEIKSILLEAKVSEYVVGQVISVLDKLSFLAYAPDAEGKSQLGQVDSEIKALFTQLKETL